MSSAESTDTQATRPEGSLSDPATLPRLLAWLGRGDWSGMVLLRAGDVERRLYFAEGRLSTAGSNDGGDSLASHLIRDGLISEEGRSRAAGQLRTTDRGWAFGKQLVKLGLLSDQDLSRAERRRVLAIARAAIGLRSGRYSCESGVVAGDAMPNQGLEMPRVVAEGVLTTWEPNSALDVLGGRHAVLGIVTETLSDYEATGAEEEYDATLLRCNGRLTVQEILDLSPLPESVAIRFLAAMCLIGCVSSEPGVAAAEKPYDPEATVPSDSVSEESDVSSAGDGEPPGASGAAAPEDGDDAARSAAGRGAGGGADVDFEAARAEAVAPPAAKAGRRSATTKSRPARSGPSAGEGSAAPAGSLEGGDSAARSRLGLAVVVLITIALLAGAGYVAWRGWLEMQAPVESP